MVSVFFFGGVGFKVLGVDNLLSSLNLFLPPQNLKFIHVEGDSKKQQVK